MTGMSEPAGPGFVSLDRFVEARLDEEEEVARRAAECYAGEAWAVVEFDYDGISISDHWPDDPVQFPTNPVTEHIGRQDPAHVLALVAAHRRILDRYRQVQPFTVHHAGIGIGLKAVAGIWSDHPDYDPTWAL